MFTTSPEYKGVPVNVGGFLRKSLMLLTAAAIIGLTISACAAQPEDQGNHPKTVLVDGVLTKLNPSIFPIQVQQKMFDPSVLCTGSQTWELPAGGTVDVPKKCGKVLIQGKITTTNEPNLYGSAQVAIAPEGNNLFKTPTGMQRVHSNFSTIITDTKVGADLDSCQQAQIVWKETIGNAIATQWLETTGVIPAFSGWNLSKAGLTDDDNDSLMALVDGIAVGEYAQRIADGKADCGGGLNDLDRSVVLSTNSGATASRSAENGEITQEEFCDVIQNGINLAVSNGNISLNLNRATELERMFSNVCP